jgi:hypothetical protein
VRTGWPLVVAESTGEVLWLCGIQIAEPARITPATTHAWVLRWRRQEVEPVADEVDRAG